MSQWNAKRIAELRSLLAGGDDGWGADMHPSEVLSLLDELESVTRERDEARLRTVDLENECSDLAKALDSCYDGR